MKRLFALLGATSVASLGLFFVTNCTGCRNTEPTTASKSNTPVEVALGTLLWDYQFLSEDRANTFWTGRVVRVRLESQRYTSTPESVNVHTGLPGAPPVAIFYCRNPPPDNAKNIILTGVCYRHVRDGRNYGAGYKGYLILEDCIVDPY